MYKANYEGNFQIDEEAAKFLGALSFSEKSQLLKFVFYNWGIDLTHMYSNSNNYEGEVSTRKALLTVKEKRYLLDMAIGNYSDCTASQVHREFELNIDEIFSFELIYCSIIAGIKNFYRDVLLCDAIQNHGCRTSNVEEFLDDEEIYEMYMLPDQELLSMVEFPVLTKSA